MQYRNCVTILAALLLATNAIAETITFGSNENQFAIEFVEIGSPNNPGDDDERLGGFLKGAGAVDYTLRMAKFEMPCSHVDSAILSGADLGSDRLLNCGNAPSIDVNAIAFVNWLNTNSGYDEAYMDNFIPWPEDDPGFNPANPIRNRNARFFLPTVDESYKAAFYSPATGTYNDYATGNEFPMSVENGTEPGTAVFCTLGHCAPRFLADVTDAGGLSAFGTMGQLGNAAEVVENGPRWVGIDVCFEPEICEQEGRGIAKWNSQREIFGGGAGFRIVSTIPETCPTNLQLVAMLGLFGLCPRRRRR